MPLADAVAGAIRPAQSITWVRTDGLPEDLTGATLTGVLLPLPYGPVRAIAGTLTVTDANDGVFSWTYHAADVVAGSYLVQFTATFGTGLTPARTFDTSWIVHPVLTVPVP